MLPLQNLAFRLIFLPNFWVSAMLNDKKTGSNFELAGLYLRGFAYHMSCSIPPYHCHCDCKSDECLMTLSQTWGKIKFVFVCLFLISVSQCLMNSMQKSHFLSHLLFNKQANSAGIYYLDSLWHRYPHSFSTYRRHFVFAGFSSFWIRKCGAAFFMWSPMWFWKNPHV